MSDRPERIARMCRLLVERGRIRRADILREVGKRQADKDLRLLRRVWDLAPVGDGRNTEWILDPVDARSGDIVDRIALVLGRELGSFLRDTPFAGALDRLGSDPGKGLRRYHHLNRKFTYVSEPARNYAARQEVIWEILEALLGERALDLCYNGRDRHDLQALTLAVYRRALYLVVRDQEERVTVLAVDRIESADTRESDRPYPASWDPRVHFAGAFGIAPDRKPEWIVLRFDQRGARYVRERTFHPTQQLHDLPDGGVELRFKAAGLELPRFVLEWGPRVEVIEPAWLREDVINQLRTALARYSDHQGDRRTVSDRVMGNSRTGTTET